MSRSVVVLALALGATAVSGSAQTRIAQPVAPPKPAIASQPTEQEWIVEEVVTALASMARFSQTAASAATPIKATLVPGPAGAPPTFSVTTGQGQPAQVRIDEHIWSSYTYAPLAASLLQGTATIRPAADSAQDLNARGALADLRVDVLLNENERISRALTRDMRSVAAHEAAALLIGAHALRESAGIFTDVRPALSRMAAHLSMSSAIRQQAPEGFDGLFARAVTMTLVGRQRDALAILTAIEPHAASDGDKAWIRALRLRNTGDWRTPLSDNPSELERLEYGRALRTRVGSVSFLDFADRRPQDQAADWQRMALVAPFNVEIGHRFAPKALDREIDEATTVWSRFHGTRATPGQLLASLNDPPSRGPIARRGGTVSVNVIDWGTWAAFYQRHVGQSLSALSRHYWNLGSPARRETFKSEVSSRFSSLTLFPIVLRMVGTDAKDYERSLALGRALATSNPELVTAAAWNAMEQKPDYVERPAPFPIFKSWFTPTVPAGTAFDLYPRALVPGCPRPPSAAQARIWAQVMPYDHWVQWSAEWYAVSGVPTAAAIQRAFGPLLEYDIAAPIKLIDLMDMPAAEHIAVAKKLCEFAPDECNRLAMLLVRDGQPVEAAATYEKWMASTRDDVGVSNHVGWLTRYYFANGKRARAAEIAKAAADTGSGAGMETLADLLDAQGSYDEAETLYRAIEERYDQSDSIGAFLLRKGIRTGDTKTENEGWVLLRNHFPRGPERLAMHALDATPKDGMTFEAFGRRAAALGLKATDVVVGVDEWRIRNTGQYWVIARLSHQEAMTLTVWRGGKYQQLKLRVPERWLGLPLANYPRP
jgi:hypothetical protein